MTPPSTPPVDQTFSELRRLEKLATRGPWERDKDGEYSANGDTLRHFVMGPRDRVLFDTSNSDARELHVEPDGDGVTYSDPVGHANLELCVAMRNQLVPLLDALDEARAELSDARDRIGKLMQPPPGATADEANGILLRKFYADRDEEKRAHRRDMESMQRERDEARATAAKLERERDEAIDHLGKRLVERMGDEMARRCRARIANIREMPKDDPQFQSYQWAANAMEQDLGDVIMGFSWPEESAPARTCEACGGSGRRCGEPPIGGFRCLDCHGSGIAPGSEKESD